MNKVKFNDDWQFCRVGDGVFQSIHLPHDAMIYEKRDDQNPSGSGEAFFNGGDYIYKKSFLVPNVAGNEHWILEFDGVYKDATIYLNDEQIGFHSYGYTNFFVDLSDKLEYGRENEIKLRVCNSDQPNSRWYSGSGIYRNVYLYRLPKKHILPNGIQLKTISLHPATIEVQIHTNASGTVSIDMLDSGAISRQ